MVLKGKKSMSKKIHIPAKKLTRNNSGVIKINPAAYDALIDVAEESGHSIKKVASLIILQAIENNLIVFDREE